MSASSNSSSLLPIRQVLVEPLKSGNIGSVARALANCNMSELVLVNPRASHFNSKARAMAANAQPLLHKAQVVSTLDEALRGCLWAVAFTGNTEKRHKERKIFQDLIPEIYQVSQIQKKKIAFVFGREDWGLDNYALDRCRYTVILPTPSAYSSLNLSQAVLLANYLFLEFFQKQEGYCLPEKEFLAYPEATVDEREQLYQDIEETFLQIDFIPEPEGAAHTMRHIRRLLERMGLDEREVRILRGICRQLRRFHDPDWQKKKIQSPSPRSDAFGKAAKTWQD